MDISYTAIATATGEGRNGHTRSSDGLIDLDLATPKELGGPGGLSNPEQLFAAGYAACFLNALKTIGRTRKIAFADAAVTAEVGIGSNGQGGFGLSVALHVEMTGVDQQTADELAAAASRCAPTPTRRAGTSPSRWMRPSSDPRTRRPPRPPSDRGGLLVHAPTRMSFLLTNSSAASSPISRAVPAALDATERQLRTVGEDDVDVDHAASRRSATRSA